MTSTLWRLRTSATSSLISVVRFVKYSPVATSPKRNGLKLGWSVLRSSISLVALCYEIDTDVQPLLQPNWRKPWRNLGKRVHESGGVQVAQRCEHARGA